MKKTFYITTAIDYVNSSPHLGHSYEKICADVIARWHRLKNEKTFFLTGTDENAQKNVRAAKEAGIAIQEFIDKNAQKFKELCKVLSISNDDFIRTTEQRHKKVAIALFEKSYKNGDIYKGFYEGLYCTSCEAFYLEKDTKDLKCPVHNTKIEYLKEESYFFKMSKYKDQIKKLISSKDFVLPESKRKELLNRIKDDLKDLSVSRVNINWGIEVPFDKKHRIYVWFDALINYISALGGPSGKKFREYWPCDIHLIGKDIAWFHGVIWPSILYSCGIDVPKMVYSHGFVYANETKMSKTTGNVIDPFLLVKKYGVDQVRYFLVREIPFGEDGNFSEEALVNRINNELANELGNLVSRSTALVQKNFNSKIKKSKIDEDLSKKLDVKKISDLLDTYMLTDALNEIFRFISEVNKYVNDKAPWGIKDKSYQEEVLYNIIEAVRIISILISPYMPSTSQKINNILDVKQGFIKDIIFGKQKSYNIKKTEILFTKIK